MYGIRERYYYIRYMLPHLLWRHRGRPALPLPSERVMLTDSQKISDVIRKAIEKKEPFSLIRPGNAETNLVHEWLEHKMFGTQRYKGQRMYRILGDDSFTKRFSEGLINDLMEADIFAYIGHPMYEVQFLNSLYGKNCIRVRADYGTWNEDLVSPWYELLSGKRVLVVSPFVESFRSQYDRYDLVCAGHRGGFPQGIDFVWLKSVWYYDNSDMFANWFQALDYLINEMKKIDFEIAILSCGPFGSFLAAEAKRMGKSAIHYGGQLQIAFGVMGARWESSQRIKDIDKTYWVRPSGEEIIDGYKNIESECYW